MLIKNLTHHFTNKTPTGVIHIGAHMGEEKQWYQQNNISPIIWIDANPNYESKLKQMFPEDTVICCGVGSEPKTIPFNVANNGESSSFLSFGLHTEFHPGINFTQSIMIKVKPMKDIIEEHDIDMNKFNFLNLDVQGYELEVLKGFGDTLKFMDFIYTEVNSDKVYQDCCLIEDIDNFLSKYSFVRVETHMTPWSWGDAFYVKTK